jgi:enterochelin esterase-like enzyme
MPKKTQSGADAQPTPTKKLVNAIQVSFPNFWPEYFQKNNHTFQEVLDKYEEYYKKLPTEPDNERKAISNVFWDQVKTIQTPIIENISEDEVRVHFLFPQKNYDSDNKKLYVAGDFHGFTSTNNERQEMHHIPETDIMHRSDVMPKDSIVVYHFLQVPLAYQNKNRPEISGPSEALPESFYDIEPIPAVEGDPLKVFHLTDEYSKHTDLVGTLFCANVDNDLSHVNLMKNTDWKKLLNADGKHKGYLKNISHRRTYLCDRNDQLSKDKNAADNFQHKLDSNTEHTRYVSVFAPSKGQVDNLVIINDGPGYMATDAVEYIDALIGDGQIPKKTAVICISQLPGLIEKYKAQSPKEFATATDPRSIEFGTKIEDYVTFIDEALKQLGYAHIPAENRTLIGSSMSGTASLYMVLEHKDKFGSAIVQAPSYANRGILIPLVQKRKLAKIDGQAEDLTARVQFSNGRFDSLEHAQNLNLANTNELAEILGNNSGKKLPVHTGNYGHTIHCWSREIASTLPNLYRKRHDLRQQNAESRAPGKRSTERQMEHYKRKMEEVRKTPQPGYMVHTESSKAKKREIFSPLPTTPKPPWRP